MTIGSIPLRFKVEIDPDQCMLCGRCVENCSYGVFRKEEDAIRVNSPELCCMSSLFGLLPQRCDKHLRETHGLPESSGMDP